jgi:DNA-binding transcriptional LysR family regulator
MSTEDFVKRHHINVSIPLELSNNEAIKTAVEEGIGIAVITRHVVNKELTMGTLKAIPLSDPTMTRKFYLIHHKDKYISRPLQSLIDMVGQWASEYRRGEL